MKLFRVITFDKDSNVTIWGTFNHHDLIDSGIPYFMKMNEPDKFIITDMRTGKEFTVPEAYYLLKKMGRYDD